MGKHDTNVERDGHGDYDHTKTKPVEESSEGTHSSDDKGGE
ncbi:hypothetical protein [Saccharopolyspora phatthalungensis]|uniref:Uncharacterized protein n=1 Tax=Saccharopolyspora phatthalungensis TaxID=664693 RepID=A0A840QDP3_9PSEU|nr:hypothetical protein [Saccharopolyspora phatthalungensis]MBB5158127.1 hypothetical protein [Saccharopolyspora phatthalungensis]